jgi:CubicO group peptidase (beta-lactamase class C family)
MKKQIIFLFILIQFEAFAQLKPQQFTTGAPESVGMSSPAFKRIDDMLKRKIAENRIAGCVGMVARKGKIVYYNALGMNDIENNKAMQKDQIFRIMSQTKAITSVAAMILYEEGRFMLDDAVSKYIPAFKNPMVLTSFNDKDSSYTAKPASREITIRMLLNHTSGIPYNHPINLKAGIPTYYAVQNVKLADKIPVLAKLPLVHEPGEKFTYGLNSDVLGYLIEVISGMPLDKFFQERIFEPLGMTDTYFFLPENKASRLVTVYEETNEGFHKKPVSHWTEYPVSGAKTYFSGGAGLTSTVMDYGKFLQMLLNGGTFNGKRILGRKTVELMTTNQIGDLEVWDRGNKFGLGFEIVAERGHSKIPSSVGAFEWGGMYYTHYFVDPKEELIGLIFFQVYPTKGWGIENQFKAMVYQALD